MQGECNLIEITTNTFLCNENYSFLFIDNKKQPIIDKIFKNKQSLKDTCFLGRGEEISKKESFITKVKGKNCPFLTGSDFGKYYANIVNYTRCESAQGELKRLGREWDVSSQVQPAHCQGPRRRSA